MKRLGSIALLFILLAFPASVHADVAPPINPPGSNLQPGVGVTQVRMLAETVLIDVEKDTVPQSLSSAHVTADFTMRNLSTAGESMAVRFPVSGDNGRGEYPEITNLLIRVDGDRVRYRRVNYPDLHYPNQAVPWAEFDVTFPAGQDIPIRVEYDLSGSGYFPYTAFYYVLETGAGWEGTIGRADIILRLPYEANAQNVVVDMPIGWGETTPGGVFQGNRVRWRFENFEPGQDQPVQNMEFVLVAPSAWETVLAGRKDVIKHPNDSEAWGMLAKVYKQIFLMSKGYREDLGGQGLYLSSVEAYERCLSLSPNDAEWHAGFADLLATRAMWDYWEKGITPETFRALEEIHTALQLAPKDPVVQEIAQNISFMFPDGMKQTETSFDFPWLTRTPAALLPTRSSTSTPTLIFQPETSATPTQPEVAPVEVETITPRPVVLAETPGARPTRAGANPTSHRPSPLCGSAALVPLILAAWFVRRQR